MTQLTAWYDIFVEPSGPSARVGLGCDEGNSGVVCSSWSAWCSLLASAAHSRQLVRETPLSFSLLSNSFLNFLLCCRYSYSNISRTLCPDVSAGAEPFREVDVDVTTMMSQPTPFTLMAERVNLKIGWGASHASIAAALVQPCSLPHSHWAAKSSWLELLITALPQSAFTARRQRQWLFPTFRWMFVFVATPPGADTLRRLDEK